MPPADAQRTSTVKRVLLVLAIVLALALIAFEIASRAADGIVERREAAHDQDARAAPHPYLGYALKPGWHSRPGDPQEVRHNSLGFRGKETTYAKPPGVFRIVTIGGSSVYGQSESSDAAVWSQRLEDHLNEGAHGVHIEVVNGGCFGYNSFENLVNLEFRMMDFHPDIVLLYEAINDMRCALWNAGGPIENDNTHWRLPWPVDRPSRIEAALEKSRAFLFWRYYFTDYTAERSDIAFWAMKGWSSDMPDAYLWAGAPPELGFVTYRRNLEDMVAVAELGGAKFVIATQALARYHLDGAASEKLQLAGFDRIQDIERDVARERRLLVIESAKVVEGALAKELEQEVEAQRKLHADEDAAALEISAKKVLHPANARGVMPPLPPPGASMFKHEVHPYDRGSELIALTIAEALSKSGLLPR